MFKKTIAATLLSASLFTSCLGPNNLFNSVNNWTAEATDMDVVNEIIFLGFTIIPVYSFAYLGDVLIFNTINYWTGENPIDDPGAFPGFTND